MARIRKALTAGVLAAAGALVTSLVAEIPQTQQGWIALLFAAAGIGVGAGIATYNVRNVGTVNGSDPQQPQPTRYRPPVA